MSRIKVEQLTKAYGERTVLTIAHWSVSEGHSVLVGSNGAGKTTLLHILSGLEEAQSGSIRVGGHAPGSAEARARLSFVPDEPALFDDLTVAEQRVYVARLHGLSEAFEASSELVEALSAEDLLDRYPRTMSKGQRQKAGLLVGTARPFDILLLDEPTTGLDTASCTGLIDVLSRRADQGCLVLSSTHNEALIQSASKSWRLHAGDIAPA